MLAIRINPNNHYWKEYEFMVSYDNPKRNVFKRHFELIDTGIYSPVVKYEYDSLTNAGFRFYSLDAINNTQICLDSKIGFLYGLKQSFKGEDAILYTKESNDLYLVGVINNIHYFTPQELSGTDEQFLSEWKEYAQKAFVNPEGQSFFEKYQSNFLNTTSKSKFAFNFKYQNLIFFEKNERIKLNEYPYFKEMDLNRRWISKIEPETFESVLSGFKL
jgi:hypothetical protein